MISGVLVELEAPSEAAGRWSVDAVDLNADGMGLVLPNALAPGTEVLLSFRLDETCEFTRVPAIVLHQEQVAGTGGVHFGAWNAADRLRLLEWLVDFYEKNAGVARGGRQRPLH